MPSDSAVTAEVRRAAATLGTALRAALRTAIRPDGTVLAVFATFLGLFVAYYFQFLLGGPVPGVDALLGLLNAPVAVLTRWLGARTVPDAVGLVVILGYYYLLAVAVGGLIRRGRVLLG